MMVHLWGDRETSGDQIAEHDTPKGQFKLVCKTIFDEG